MSKSNGIRKVVGYNYLHSHMNMEVEFKIPKDHVIVDREDYEAVVMFFNEHPELIDSLGKHRERIVE